ncbi:MAG: lytic transglycosylase domain-containing protein [Verrucomicrobiota bacterium]
MMRILRWCLLLGAALAVVLSTGIFVHFGLDRIRRERMRAECEPLIAQSARRHHVSRALIAAVIQQESRFDSRARGGAGEVGLMQITHHAIADWAHRMDMPAPGKYLAHDPAWNIEVGAWYLGRALERWRGYADSEVLALAEYNAGPTHARRWAPEIAGASALDNVSFPGTRRYINRVLSFRMRFDEDSRNAQK